MKTNVNVETRSSQRKKFKGVVKGTRQRFGFLNINGHNDIFIKPQEMDRVFSGDVINVTVNDYGTDRQSVSIDEVVDSKFKTCIGVFKEDDTGAYVLPDNYGFNRMIRIPKSYRRGAENGDYVKIEIIEHPFQSKKPKAKVLQVIGKPDSLGVEAEYSIAKKGLSTRLNPAIHEECDNLISNYAKINDGLKRKNLTKLNFITIDGDNTVDIDDAVYVQKLKNKWKLLVAISDVSEFIEENSLIDNEAYNRTSTVYLLGRTIPMLPSELAHEYLSLKEGEKKAVLIADMTLDLDGRLDKYEFYEAFIESKSRFTYNEVDSFIETGRLDDDKLKYKEDIKNLRDLQGLLTEKRKAHSIIPAKRNDYKFLLDENKQIENIEFLSQQTSYKIIEEAMLLANRCAADFISDYEEGIFKAQEGILEAKKKMLSQYLRQHIFFENSMFEDFKDFKHLYKLIENREDSESIKQVLSLNLKKSYYVTEKRKHYVMGFDGYTYFTSPIRRYVDILVHRMIKAKINKKKYSISKPDYISHFTKKEKDIRECSLAVEQWLKANYIAKHSEVEFEAKVISISNFGLHVKIGINGIEGFIPIGDLGDRKDVFKKSDLEMIVNKNSFKINDIVSVRLKEVQEEASLIFKML